MGLLNTSLLLVTLFLALPAGSQANTQYVFNFENDLEGWSSSRDSWRWGDKSSLQGNTIPSDYYKGFAVMDKKFTSGELYTPYFTVPQGGNFTMKFYLRSEYHLSNTLKVYTKTKYNTVKQFLDLKDYSMPTTNSWNTVQKELPAEYEDIMFEIFCYNGDKAPAGQPLWGCAIDKINFEIYGDVPTAVPTTPPPTTAEPTTEAPTTAPPTTPAPTTPEPTTPEPTTAFPTTPEPTTAFPTTAKPTTAFPTTAFPTTAEPTTAFPTTAFPTTAEPTTAFPTTAEPTTAFPTTAFPTTAFPTTAFPTTAEPTTAFPTTAFPTTAFPTTAFPTTAFPTTAEPTTAFPTTAEPTTAFPTTAFPTTEFPTTAEPTTAEPTTAFPTTAFPTTTEPTTAEPTTAFPTTAFPTTAFPTTAFPTTAPSSTAPPTTAFPTTAFPTTAPPTTAYPTTAEPTTAPPTTAFPTTAFPTTANPTTAEPTTAPPTTPPPTTAPPTTAEPTTANPTTEEPTTAPPTTAPPTTAEPTTAFPTTANPTTANPTTAEPTTAPPTTPPPTTAPPTTAEPTTANPTTANPTTAEPTTAPPTTAPPTTAPPTTAPPTTAAPGGPITFSFESGMEGWSLVHMNEGAFRRVHFEDATHRVGPPPDGPHVLQLFADNVQAGTVVAKSPRLRAIKDEMMIVIRFWMDGSQAFPAQLKLRRQFSYDNFEDAPVVNLDAFGDQINTIWFKYTKYKKLEEGETFYLFMEASLGGDVKNSVAVSSIQLDGVQVIEENESTLFDFEGGLTGWTAGMKDGGIWELTTWDKLDPSLNVPKPVVGEKFLIASRSSIYSGTITLESPIMEVSQGTSQLLEFQFYLRGTVTYPVVLRIRKKTPDGTYDALPFIDLRKYGNVDYQQWMRIEHEVEIPVNPEDTQYQLVLEVDLGTHLDNVVALDDIQVTQIRRR